MLEKILENFAEHKRLLGALLLIFGVAVAVGCLLPHLLTAETVELLNAQVELLFDGLAGEAEPTARSFGSVLLGELILLLVWLACAYFVPGAVPAVLLLVWRGMLLGLCAALLLSHGYAYGVLVIVLVLLPSQLFLGPMYVLATFTAICSSRRLLSEGFTPGDSLIGNAYCFGILLLPTVIGSWFSACASPVLLDFVLGLV